MTDHEPRTTLDPAFSSPDATPLAWSDGRAALERAELFWLTTVRPDGRPHVTPLIAVWLDEALYFCTGAQERKAKNMAANAEVALTTGCNALNDGLDLVVEGVARRVTDGATLARMAAGYEAKSGGVWHFDVRGDTLAGDEGNVAQVYAVAPRTAFGFQKGEPFGQTRWQFAVPRSGPVEAGG